MKRIKAACLLQTLHFGLKDDLDHEAAVRAVQEEVRIYKMRLNARHTNYRIDEEIVQPDGSVIIKIRKQYNTNPVGEYIS